MLQSRLARNGRNSEVMETTFDSERVYGSCKVVRPKTIAMQYDTQTSSVRKVMKFNLNGLHNSMALYLPLRIEKRLDG